MYVKRKPRLTRHESQEATRRRLIEAAAQAFIRHGFDAASVETIVAEAGFSRGAFYSNFSSKDELLLAVLQANRQEFDSALHAIVRRETDPARRLRAILDWYVNQNVNRGWMMLEMEFTLRACRNRRARVRMEEFNRQRAADYSALIGRHFEETGAVPAGRPENIALVLFAAAKGLAALAMVDSSAGGTELYAECRDLVFKRLMAAKGSQE
jgi:AcrR family transcriptional regulator